MIVNVDYTVPVTVQVDTVTSEVIRVVIHDELATRELGTSPMVAGGDMEAPPVEIAKLAIAIAEGEAEWPEWDKGW